MALTIMDDPGGPVFVPISFTSDVKDNIVEPTTVRFTLTVPLDEGEPDLEISLYEVQSQPEANSMAEDSPSPLPIYQYLAMAVFAYPDVPIPVWKDGVAHCSYDIDYNVVQALRSSQTVLAFVARIVGDTNSVGICNVAISFPPSKAGN